MNINNPGENNFEKKLEINEILENLKNETKIDIEYALLIEIYKEFLKRIIPELQKIGLKVDEDGSLDFKNLKCCNFWPKINGKNLTFFPSSNFNKKHGIGNKNGYIYSKKNLIELFDFFGFKINKNNFKSKKSIKNEKILFKNTKEEKLFYKEKIEEIIPKLQNLGLEIDEKGKLFFENLNSSWRKIKINGKNLSCFPNINFNKKYNIGNKNGIITRKIDLAKLFELIGFEINKYIFDENFGKTEKEKLLYFKKNLETIIPKLLEIGVEEEKDGSLNFKNLKNYSFWPRVRGILLTNFPSLSFNKKHKIGNNDGFLKTTEDLEKLFKFFGFKITKNLENNKTKDDIKNILEYNEYKEYLKNLIPVLEKSGLKIDENLVLDFSGLKQKIFIKGKEVKRKEFEYIFEKYGFQVKKED